MTAESAVSAEGEDARRPSAEAGVFTAPSRTHDWARKYAIRLVISDFIVICAAVIGAHLFWMGLTDRGLPVAALDGVRLGYASLTVIIIVTWMLILAGYDTRDRRVIGIGSMEYKRVIDSSLRLFGLLAIAALILQLDLARGYVLTAFPLGLFLLVLERWLWRKWLVRRRERGRYSSRVLLVGSAASVREVEDLLHRHHVAGYVAVGVCLPAHEQSKTELHGEIPVVGDLNTVVESAAAMNVDAVILTSSDHLPPRLVKRISWSMESTDIDLIMAPALLDTAGPRIHTRPFAGLPLLHVETPRYDGSKQATKAVFDFVAALVAIILVSPILLVTAIVVKATSKGPVFFKQRRVGRDGREFMMFKFRTMVENAEQQLELLRDDNEADGPLFKLRNDPRVTPVGRVLRRYSIDELPQFFNVLTGDMSVVGPRPPLVAEVEKYEPHVRRRLLVKPGVTGPWQIYGRSDLTWDEGVRLDLFYVENWTLFGDLILIVRTVRAVFVNKGAY